MVSIKWFVRVILFSLVCATGLPAGAQTLPAPAPTPAVKKAPSPEHDFFKNILRDQKAIWTAPLHIERSDAKWMVPAGIGLMALFTTDRITGDEIGEANGQVSTSHAISYAGSVYGTAAIATTFYVLGRKNHDYRARETGVLAAEAVIDSIIVEGALKGITQRARPSTGAERSEFFDGGSSFPSGHSTQAWALATVIASEYKHRRAVQVAAYGIATAVSVARFTGHNHYLSDVVVGSALGFGIGRYVYGAHHRDITNPGVSESAWPRITPQFNRQARRYGVGLTWNF